jgi:hypothetical protein
MSGATIYYAVKCRLISRDVTESESDSKGYPDDFLTSEIRRIFLQVRRIQIF